MHRTRGSNGMRIHYVYPSPMEADMAQVENHVAPSDRMYGLVELRNLGHEVDFSDWRFSSRIARCTTFLRPAANLADLYTLPSRRRYDVVVVKDAFSTLLTLSGRARRLPIVYLDALFAQPRRILTTLLHRANLAMADGHVVYSRRQASEWTTRFRLAETSLQYVPYCIDLSFYRAASVKCAPSASPYIVSVGRDMGRSFGTLIDAVGGLGLHVKLVTLPYLLREVDTRHPCVEIFQHLSYAELFELYAGALLVVIPLKDGLSYPSGVRGLLEALALGKAVVATRTPVLEEYVPERNGVLYVPANDTMALREAIIALRDNAALRLQLEEAGRPFVWSRYNMPVFASALEDYLGRIVSGKAR